MTTVSAIFLAVSVTALLIQALSLRRLLRDPPPGRGTQLAYRGLVRTCALRVAVAALYTALGIGSLLAPPTTGVAALAVFAATQCVWLAASLADLRLKNRLATGGSVPGRHRKGREGR